MNHTIAAITICSLFAIGCASSAARSTDGYVADPSAFQPPGTLEFVVVDKSTTRKAAAPVKNPRLSFPVSRQRRLQDSPAHQ